MSKPRRTTTSPVPSPEKKLPGPPRWWSSLHSAMRRQAAYQVLRAIPGPIESARLRRMVLRRPLRYLVQDVALAGRTWPTSVIQENYPCSDAPRPRPENP